MPPRPRRPLRRGHHSAIIRMKKTVIYTRVSTDEQAEKGFSLRDQEARLRDYCAKTGREVVAHHQDDASARTFERPAFQQFLDRLSADPTHIDELVVVKWDRFSRDMTGALAMIRTLREQGVSVQAIEQPIDFDVPEQAMLLAVYLAAPQIENDRRSMNTTMGIRRALREGRWCNAAPKGYSLERVGQKGVLTPNDDAPLVREAFELAAGTDLAISEILLRLRRKGFRCRRSEFYNLLRKIVYTGRIEVPAWRDEPMEIVDGVHDAIVPIALFDKVQVERFGDIGKRQPKTRGGVKPDHPLRGHIACPKCSTQAAPKRVTASVSGGNGGRYAYYHCHRCGGFRVRAGDVHEAIPGFLRGIALEQGVADLYREVVSAIAREAAVGAGAEVARLEVEVERIEGELLKVDEMFFGGDLEADSYRRLKLKRQKELTESQDALVRHQEGGGTEIDLDDIVAAADLLEALPAVWSAAEAEGNAQALYDLIGSIAPSGFVYEGGSVRTPWGMAEIAAQAPETTNADSEAESASGVVAGARFELTIFGL